MKNTINSENEEIKDNELNEVQQDSNTTTNEPTNEQVTSEVENSSENQQPTQEKMEDWSAKIDELQSKYLRLSAEFDNYRKRTLKEKMELVKSGGEDILKNIIPVVDNFERGLKAMQTARDLEAVKEGMVLIYNNFIEFLAQKGVKPMTTLHQTFDTDMHEALTKIPAPTEDLKGKVVDEIEKGYTLNDKVIRFAKVVVGD